MDSGDYWHGKMKRHLTKDLNMRKTTGSLACFSNSHNGYLTGIIIIYTDNTIETETTTFDEGSKVTGQLFNSRPRKFIIFIFSGIFI